MRLMSTFFFFRSSCSSSAATHGGMRLQQSLSLACWTFNGIALAFAQIWGTCYIYIYIILYLSIWSHLIKSNVLLIEDIKGTLVFVDVVWDLMGPSQSIQAAAGCKSSMGCPSVTTACRENDMVNIGEARNPPINTLTASMGFFSVSFFISSIWSLSGKFGDLKKGLAVVTLTFSTWFELFPKWSASRLKPNNDTAVMDWFITISFNRWTIVAIVHPTSLSVWRPTIQHNILGCVAIRPCRRPESIATVGETPPPSSWEQVGRKLFFTAWDV